MLEGIVGSIVSAGLKEFFAQLFQNLFGWLDKQQQAARDRELGRLEAQAVQAVAAARAAAENARIAAQDIDLEKRLDEGAI